MSAGLVGQSVGRAAAVQTLGASPARLAYTNAARTTAGDALTNVRIGLLVRAYTSNIYFKIFDKDADISAVTVSSADCDDVIVAGTGVASYFMPLDRNSEPVFSAAAVVSAVEFLGTVD